MRLKALLAIMFCLALLVPTAVQAQVSYTGSLFVKVTEESGNAVEGVALKLAGQDFTREATTSANGHAHFTELAPGRYELEVASSGYNTQVYPKIDIDTLASVSFNVTLQTSDTVKRVIVPAETPLLDKRRTGTSTALTQDEMTQVPTARDPWAVLQTIPGVTSDRINVGGSEAGQQAFFVGKGDDGEQSTWIMDGVDITNNAVERATQSYLDFNAFEQISFVTAGGSDIEQAYPGVRLNFVTKQGGNQHTGTARMIYTEEDLQANFNRMVSNPTTNETTLISSDHVTKIFEKNFDIGGPLLKDYLWYWFGFTETEVDLVTSGTQDESDLRNISIKANGQVGGNLTYRAMWTEGDKTREGLTQTADRSLPTTWNQSDLSRVTTAAVSYFFTPDLEVAGQWGEVEGGFALTPKAGSGPGTQIIVDQTGTWQNTFIDFSTERPTEQYSARVNWFTETFGWDHELKFGFKYKEAERSSTSLYGGDGVLAFQGSVGNPGVAYLYRIGDYSDETSHTNFWAGDTVLKGPWAINVGVHVSRQDGQQNAGTVPANPLCDGSASCPGGIPALNFAGFDPNVEWEDTMLRAGVTYTFGGERRLLLRAAAAAYADSLSNADIGYNNPVAPSSIGYFWDDGNGGPRDALVQLGELDFASGPIGTSNFNPANPSSATSPDAIDSNMDAPTVKEFILGAEYELMRNFTVGATLTKRNRQDELWTPLYDVSQFDPGTQTGTLVRLPSSIYSCQTVSGTDASGFGRTYSEEVCTIADASNTTRARNSYLTNDGSLEADYLGLEITATKRLSNSWMLRGYLAFTEWKKSFSGEPLSNGAFGVPPSSRFVVPDGDPTNLAGDTNVDGSDIAYQSDGSGPTSDIWPGSASWTFNVNGLYQLPWFGLQVSGNVTGREGYSIPVMFINTIRDVDFLIARKSVQVDAFGSDRYDDIFLLDLRVAKLIKLGGGTTVELAAEMFNVFDDKTALSVSRSLENRQGNPYGSINQAVSPRIARFVASINF